MPLVNAVIAELKAHSPECPCRTCLWATKADPVKDLARRRILGRLWEIIS